MNKEWFTAQDLAGLVGVPSTDRRVRSKAAVDGWQSRKRAGTKGLEYHISSLPLVTQQALAKQAASDLLQSNEPIVVAAKRVAAQLNAEEESNTKTRQLRKEKSSVLFNSLPEKAQNRANAKLAILQALDVFLVPYCSVNSKTEGVKRFVDAYNARQISLPEWVISARARLSAPSLYRWQKKAEQHGISALAGIVRVERPHLVEANQRMVQFFTALLTAKPHLEKKPQRLRELALVQAAQEMEWNVPSASSIRRWVKKWVVEHSAEFAYVTNPDGYNNEHRPIFQKMYPQYSRPNDVWEFDSTPVDVQLNVDGKLRRYSIIAAIDVITRRARLLLAPTSDSEGICLLLRQCLLTWGMLNDDGMARTDNGSDYVSKRTTGIFALLDIRQSRADAYSGWQKPHIERFFGTMSRNLMEVLPGYIGHDVSDRKQIEAARAFCERIGKKNRAKAQKEALELALTPAQMEQALSDWLEYYYHHKPHDELDGMTPFQVYQQSGYQPKVITEAHALDLLLNYVGDASVIRGRVSAGGIKYTSHVLMEAQWDKRRVRVFLDPCDVGRATLYPLDSWGEYVEAVNSDLIGREISPAEYRDRRKEQGKVLREYKRGAKKLQEEFGIDTLAARELAAAKARNQSLTGFPMPELEHGNAAITALASAASVQLKKPGTEFTDEQRDALARRRGQERELLRQQEERKAQLLRSEEEQAWHLSRKALIEPLNDKEQAWLELYRKDYYLVARRIDFTLRKEQEAKAQGQ